MFLMNFANHTHGKNLNWLSFFLASEDIKEEIIPIIKEKIEKKEELNLNGGREKVLQQVNLLLDSMKTKNLKRKGIA